ncbi:LuxR C-terminal-related transcriptional regulator [Streptomyces sp. NPDC091268]|uniref:helix-turn-helix transcriptional regulator n=1 Tax=Streptomyces sp. NPDC091268 TaxID=3365979 RepID=UPI00382F1981
MKTGSTRPLISREEELAVVRGRFAALTDDGPALVAIAGDPGRGKTRLLSELAAWAASAGAEVLTLDATDLPLPGGAGIRPHPAPVPPPAGVREPARGPATGAAPGRPAASAGLVVLLDDLHLAGPAARQAVLDLLRTPPRPDTLLVVAYRPRQCPPRLLAGLTAAHRTWRTEHLDLADLDRAAAEEFAGAGLCHRHRAALHGDSGGNPRHLALLAASCAGQGACAGDTPAGERFAAREAAPLLAEVSALGGRARLVAYAAAVLGESADPDALADVSRLERGAVLAAVDVLLAADVLRPAAVPGHVEFRHPLLRRLVHTAVPGGWRLEAHRRAAVRHRRSGHPATRYARHLEQASRPGDEAAASELLAAAAESDAYEPATATAWYAAAARLLPDTAAHLERRRSALTAAAAAAVRTGRTDLARAALADRDRLRTGSGSGAPDAEAAGHDARSDVDAARQRAALARLDGDLPRAREILRAALAEPAAYAARPDLAAALWTPLAQSAGHDGEARARDWSDEAVLAAADSGDQAAGAHALAVHGTLRLAAGAAAAARRDALAAARITDGLDDRGLATRLDALDCLARLETELEQYGPAVRHFTRGLEIGRATGQWPAAAALAAGLGTLLLRQGRCAEAAARAEEALRCAELVDAREPRVMALCLRAQAALEVHEPHTAVAVARAACALAPAAGAWWHRARTVLAAAELAAGDALGSLETLAGAGLGDPAHGPLPLAERVALAETLCAAALAAGRTDAARGAARHARAAADELGLAGLGARAGLLEAAVCEDPADALRLADGALSAAAGLGHLADEGRARIAAARALARLGEPDRAARHLAAAAYTATACASVRLAREATAAREEAEAAPAEAAYMLSQREYEISLLVSQGCTNRQIARTLGVSHKTVETHLGRIFAKLEVSSRAEIANMIGRNTVVARPRARAKALAGAAAS